MLGAGPLWDVEPPAEAGLGLCEKPPPLDGDGPLICGADGIEVRGAAGAFDAAGALGGGPAAAGCAGACWKPCGWVGAGPDEAGDASGEARCCGCSTGGAAYDRFVASADRRGGASVSGVGDGGAGGVAGPSGRGEALGSGGASGWDVGMSPAVGTSMDALRPSMCDLVPLTAPPTAPLVPALRTSSSLMPSSLMAPSTRALPMPVMASSAALRPMERPIELPRPSPRALPMP
ncbi:MAG TPA: hypothetical protein VF821_00210, partial [Lentzea sp.]